MRTLASTRRAAGEHARGVVLVVAVRGRRRRWVYFMLHVAMAAMRVGLWAERVPTGEQTKWTERPCMLKPVAFSMHV